MNSSVNHHEVSDGESNEMRDNLGIESIKISLKRLAADNNLKLVHIDDDNFRIAGNSGVYRMTISYEDGNVRFIIDQSKHELINERIDDYEELISWYEAFMQIRDNNLLRLSGSPLDIFSLDTDELVDDEYLMEYSY